MIRAPHSRGFTLIEVIVALVILSIALLGFHQGQAGSVRMSLKAENKSQAYLLAQKKMTEIETQLHSKGFKAFSDEEKGEFKEEAFQKFKWMRKFEKVDVSCFLPEPPSASESNDSSTSTSSPQSGFFQMAQKIFEDNIRKIVITIEWTEGGHSQTASLSQLFVRYDDLPQF